MVNFYLNGQNRGGEREDSQINKIRNKKGDTAAYTCAIQRIIQIHIKNLCCNTVKNLKLNKFPDTYYPPNLNLEDRNNLKGIQQAIKVVVEISQ